MQGCGLGLDVSVSRRSRDVPTSRLGLSHLRLVPKTNFRPNCAGHSTQCERALDVVGAYAVVTIAHHINTLQATTMNVMKDNIQACYCSITSGELQMSRLGIQLLRLVRIPAVMQSNLL